MVPLIASDGLPHQVMRWFLGVSSTNDETGGGKLGGNGGSHGEVKCGSSSHLIASDCLTGRLTDCLPPQVKCGSSSHRNDARSGLDLPNKVTFERGPDLPNKDPSEIDTRSWQDRLCCCLQPTQLQVAMVAVNMGAVNMGAAPSDGTAVTIAPAATGRSAAASGHAGPKGGAIAGAGPKGGATAGAGAAKGGGTAGAAKGEERGSEGRGARGGAAPVTAPEGHATALDAAKRCNERFDWAGARAALAPWTHQHDARTLIERTICNLQVTKPDGLPDWPA